MTETPVLPANWRQLSVEVLRDWIQQQPDPPKYLVYKRKKFLIEWIEKHARDRQS